MVCAPPLPFFFFFSFSFPSLLLLLASCSRLLEIWLLDSAALRPLEEDEVNGLRLLPLGLERGGCSLCSDSVEGKSSGSSSRDWELPGNGDSSDVVEGVL